MMVVVVGKDIQMVELEEWGLRNRQIDNII